MVLRHDFNRSNIEASSFDNAAAFDLDLGPDAPQGGLEGQFGSEMNALDLNNVRSQQWKIIFKALNDPRVSEVEVNGPDSVFLMVNGQREPIGKTVGQPVAWASITDFQNTMTDVESHTAHYGKSYKDSMALWEGGLRLKDMSGRIKIKARFHCLKPPVCEFPLVTIAKQSTSITSLEAIQKSGSMTTEMMMFIQLLVKTKQTIVFSGGTGAGKTTFMSACCAEMDPAERVGIYEDAPELDIHESIPNTINVMSFPAGPGIEAKDQADLFWCVRQAQRQRVDRILIGETRDEAFQGFITAANSGFDGSMTTLHANDPRQALKKMAMFLKRAPGNDSAPMSAINNDIAMSINYIIQLSRVTLHNGTRAYRVISIEEISNIVGTDDAAQIKTQPIYQYIPEADSWKQQNYPENDKLRAGLLKLKETHSLRNNPALDGIVHTSLQSQSFLNTRGAGSRFR